MKALYQLSLREFRRFYRQKSRIVGTLLTPLLFWVVLGGGVRAAGALGSRGAEHYLQYFFPGILVLSVLFTSIFFAMGLIQDRNEGFLQGVWVSAIPRSVIVLSKCLGAAMIALLQSILLFFLAPFAGIDLSFLQVVLSFLLLFLGSVSLASLSFYFAWKINSTEGFHSIMNLVLMPMWFLSGAVFPIKSENSEWIYYLSRLNPLSYLTESMQDLLFRMHFQSIPLTVGILLGFSVGMLFFSLNSMREVRRH